MKSIIIAVLIIYFIAMSPLIIAYSWTEYGDTQFIDLDGDLADEIIMESKHGAGSGHYVEDMRIFKDKYPELELIFSIRTLDSYFGFDSPNNHAVVSDVKFTEPNSDDGTRNIVVESKKIYYKDDEHKVVDKEEDLGTEIFMWNGKIFISER